MKYNLTVENADTLFDKVEKSEMFASERSVSGLSVKYNGVFTVISNPKINLIKLSDTEIRVDILPGFVFLLISILFTILFWAIAAAAIVMSRLNVPIIIIVFLLPSAMWILQHVFNKEIAKQVNEELLKL